MTKFFILFLLIVHSYTLLAVGPRKSHDNQYSEEDLKPIMEDVRRDIKTLWANLIEELHQLPENLKEARGPNGKLLYQSIFENFTQKLVAVFRGLMEAHPALPNKMLAVLMIDPMFFSIECNNGDNRLQNLFQQFGLLRRFDYHAYVSFLDILMMFAAGIDREYFLTLLNDVLAMIMEQEGRLDTVYEHNKMPPIVLLAIVWLEVIKVDSAQVDTRNYEQVYSGLMMLLSENLCTRTHYDSNHEPSSQRFTLLAIFVSRYLKSIIYDFRDKSLLKNLLLQIKQLLPYAGNLGAHNLEEVCGNFRNYPGFNSSQTGAYHPYLNDLVLILRTVDPGITVHFLLGGGREVPVQELLHQPLTIHNMPPLIVVENELTEEEIYTRSRPALLRFLRQAYRSIRLGLRNAMPSSF